MKFLSNLDGAKQVSQDTNNRFVSDAEKATWNAKASGSHTHPSSDITDFLNKVYPVGAIYLSAVATSPATLFGGTWVALTGRMLIGVDTTYTNGLTGGSATHVLTEAELAVHDHSIAHDHASVASGVNSVDHTHASSGTTGNDNTEHTHAVSGTTGNVSADHTHYVPAQNGTANAGGGHGHSARYKGFALTASAGGWMVLRRNEAGDSYDGTDGDGAIGVGDHTHTVSTNAVNTGGISANHTHAFSATTGGRSAYHQHTYSNTTGANSADHTHAVDIPTFSGNSANAGSASAHNNLPPYLAVHMWKRTA